MSWLVAPTASTFRPERAGYPRSMEFGALFILVIFVIVIGVLGGGSICLHGAAAPQGARPREDKLKGPETPEQGERPEHVEVDNEQRARFVRS